MREDLGSAPMTEQICDVDRRFPYPAAWGTMAAQSNIPSWNPLAIETLDEHAKGYIYIPRPPRPA